MSTTRLRFGIPDIELPRTEGGKVNPGWFAGHVLVVVFCPNAPDAEASELSDYIKRGCDLNEYGAWLLTVSGSATVPERQSQCPTATSYDPDGIAWRAFCDIAPPALKLDREKGATFLFGRGGSLQQVWVGPGHAADVINELAQPCSETTGIDTAS